METEEQVQAASKIEWKATAERPGYFGKRRDARLREYDKRHGRGNWRIAWKWKNGVIDKHGVIALYEDAYYHFLMKRPDVLRILVSEASDVYDNAPSNVESGFNYMRQEVSATHLQDISIRRVVLRLGATFRGKELIQIRDKDGPHPLSMELSPGQVPFHFPEHIEKPELEGWWKPGSVESFYQSNKIIQVAVFP